MEETRTGRRERRRRKTGARAEGNRATGTEFEKTIENVEFSIGPRVAHSFDGLGRRDAGAVPRSKSDFRVGNADDADDVARSPAGSPDGDPDSANLARGLEGVSESSADRTYDVERPPGWNEFRPVPAPRKRKSRTSEVEKISSDTDRDVTEIDLDEPRPRSPAPGSEASSRPPPAAGAPADGRPGPELLSAAAPVPKPRKTVEDVRRSEPNPEESKSEASKPPTESPKVESFEEKTAAPEENPETEADRSTRPDRNELPLLADLHDEAEAENARRKWKKRKKLVGDLPDRKGKKKKSRTLASLMKLEKKAPKIPSASKASREGGERGEAEAEADAEGDGRGFRTRRGASAPSGQIYVQGKSGFRPREREEVLGRGSRNSEKGGNGGMTAASAVQTAVLLQKYWSRAMTYFHGVLAGFGFGHAAMVTAVMIHCDYDPRDFVGVYSCLSLKIHYAFYALTALCIVSCFDRIDVGHVNRKHWEATWKSPSAWVVLVAYAVAFALTLAGQTTEARFDALAGGNETEVWGGRTRSEIQAHLLQWYHGAWARDALVLFAWLVVALAEFEDRLLSHVGNMARCAEARGEERALRQKTDRA